MTITFNSKETYLQYRAVWKQQYAALSTEIRACKVWRREDARAFNKLDPKTRWQLNAEAILVTKTALIPENMRETIVATRKRYTGQYGGSCAPWTCLVLAKQATALLTELKLAKVEAQRQYLESRKLVTTVAS